MSLVKIRGSQIQAGTLTDSHIASDAAIAESKLNINWASHASTILQQKKVVDYVQVNGTAIGSGASLADVTATLGAGSARTTSAGTAEGIITDAPSNKAPIRDQATGNPMTAVIGGVAYEVFGRLTWNATTSKFELKFYTASGAAGADASYAFTAAATIDWQYLKRFNLDSVAETFAANEKFVEGAADASAALNLEQIKKDLYGTTGTLDRDGNANLTKSLVDQIADEITNRQNADSGLDTKIGTETSGVTNTTVKAKNVIDEVVAARAGSATLNDRITGRTQGATNTTVTAPTIIDEVVAARGASANLDARLDGIDSTVTTETSGVTNTTVRAKTIIDEVVAARAGKNDSNAANTYASLDARLDNLDAKTFGVTNTTVRASTVIDEVVAARNSATFGAFGSLDARLEDIDSRIGSTSGSLSGDLETRTKELDGSGVLTGLTVTAGTGLSANYAAGTVYTPAGKRFALTAGSVAVPASSTVKVYVTAAGAVAQAATVPADGVYLADVTSSATAVTTVADKRTIIFSGGEVVTARGAYANLDARLDGIDSTVTTRTTGTTNTNVTASAVIDEVVTARNGQASLDARLDAMDTTIGQKAVAADLASTAAGKGASLVGVEDAGARFTGATVEAALAEAFDKGKAAVDEVVAARVGKNTSNVATTYTSLDLRLDDIDTRVYNEEQARTNADTAIRNDLASTAASKGASLIGVQDSAAVFTGTTVETVLKELNDGYKAGDTAIKNDLASTTAAKGASMVGIQDANARFTATTVEGALDEVKAKADASESALNAAKGTAASLDARLDVSINEDGTLKKAAGLRTHYKYVVQAAGGESIINLPAGAPAFVVGDDSLDVFVNGLLQAKGLHYTEKADGTGVDFSPETLMAGDVVTFKYHKQA